MLQTSLAFESQRKTGRLPQAALVVHLLAGVVLFASDGFSADDVPVFYLADGTYRADGSITAGGVAEIVERGLVSFGQLDEGDGSSPLLAVVPSRRWSARVDLDNATGRISDFMLYEPILGAYADIVFTFPGLSRTERCRRFTGGQVARVTLADDRASLDVQSA